MFTSVAQANAAVIEQIRRARPHWLDVQPASSLISELNEGKTLLHAGPPMRWQEMTGPMKGACVGACLFEGWAKDEAQALAILEQGEVNFIPCHHVNAVDCLGVRLELWRVDESWALLAFPEVDKLGLVALQCE